jgi:hypothetical protein
MGHSFVKQIAIIIFSSHNILKKAQRENIVMRIITLGIIFGCFMLSSILGLAANVMAEQSVGHERETAHEPLPKGDKPGKAPMRVEEPDGTLRPLPQAAMPENYMSAEGLQEVPDAGGGTMVNVEGRFQSILQVPEGSDKAIHGNKCENLQQLEP